MCIVVAVGILSDFTQVRMEETGDKVKEFAEGPVKFFRRNQPVRKTVALYFLELLRPEVDAQWEKQIADWKGDKNTFRR